MKYFLFFLMFCFSTSIHSKEWSNLNYYKKETQKQELSSSDWLKADRTHNTLVWQRANRYNLNNDLSNEYETIKQRRDFYNWLCNELKQQGHEVVWPSMAHLISSKLQLIQTFPYSIFIKKKIKLYALEGNELVFKNAFEEMKHILNSETILKGNEALQWDKAILYKEQYIWIESLYEKTDEDSLKRIENMAKGKFLFGFFVPKAIRFEGDISNVEDRYDYAFNKLRPYCKTINK